MPIVWNPLNVIHSNEDGHSDSYAVVMLNHSLDKLNSNDDCSKFLGQLWDKGFTFYERIDVIVTSAARVRVSVDGGTNYLREKFSSFKMPDIVSGDFDSIKPPILSYYKEQNSVRVIETADQDETDFTKAIKELLKEITEKSITLNRIIALWSMDGRFDHVMSIIHTLYTMISIKIPLILYDVNNSLSWLLTPGEHTIESNAHCAWCALIPVGEPCTVTTQGLRWNLNDQRLAFGSLISTSNEFDFKHFKQVKVKTDKPLLWSMDISKTELMLKT